MLFSQSKLDDSHNVSDIQQPGPPLNQAESGAMLGECRASKNLCC